MWLLQTYKKLEFQTAYVLPFPCSPSLHIARSKELEAVSRLSKAYLVENGGVHHRPAPNQPRSYVNCQGNE